MTKLTRAQVDIMNRYEKIRPDGAPAHKVCGKNKIKEINNIVRKLMCFYHPSASSPTSDRK